MLSTRSSTVVRASSSSAATSTSLSSGPSRSPSAAAGTCWNAATTLRIGRRRLDRLRDRALGGHAPGGTRGRFSSPLAIAINGLSGEFVGVRQLAVATAASAHRGDHDELAPRPLRVGAGLEGRRPGHPSVRELADDRFGTVTVARDPRITSWPRAPAAPRSLPRGPVAPNTPIRIRAVSHTPPDSPHLPGITAVRAARLASERAKSQAMQSAPRRTRSSAKRPLPASTRTSSPRRSTVVFSGASRCTNTGLSPGCSREDVLEARRPSRR